jgi:PAS domain S-box-containing protein
MEEDQLVFLEEDENLDSADSSPIPWKVLIVDDDQDVHESTVFSLKDSVVLDRPFIFLHAYSGKEAVDILGRNTDVVIVLLDAVMETEGAGLSAVHTIREEMGMADVRIILRTGQPGQVPELETIAKYDINDYKTKGELTRTKLLTSIISALRSWDQIQKLKDSSNQLERSERFINSLLSAVPVPVFFKDREGRYLGCNRAFTEILGLTSQDIRGKTVEELFPGELARKYHSEDLKLMESAEHQVYEFSVIDKEGRSRTVIFAKDVFRDECGDVAGIVGAFVDITEHKSMEERLRNAKEAAEKADHAKSLFLANMSHELRTPLGGISGILSILQSKLSDSKLKSMAGMALQSTERLTELLIDILDVAACDAGEMSIRSESFDLKEQLEQVDELFRTSLYLSGASLQINLDPDTPVDLIGDAPRIQHMLSILIGNAFKFGESAEVVVDVCKAAESKDGELRILFSVTDSGVGMSDQVTDELFMPFTQSRMEYSRGHQGTGLGLAICKRLVKLMKGNISVDSEEGKGTTFYVSIPFLQSS